MSALTDALREYDNAIRGNNQEFEALMRGLGEDYRHATDTLRLQHQARSLTAQATLFAALDEIDSTTSDGDQAVAPKETL